MKKFRRALGLTLIVGDDADRALLALQVCCLVAIALCVLAIVVVCALAATQ